LLFFVFKMEKIFTINELLKIINDSREKEELRYYTLKELYGDLESEEVYDDEGLNLIQCVGLLAYQSHFVRFLATKELLKETHFTVSDFCKEHKIEMDFGEIIAISKFCQKISDKENKVIKTKLNKNNKEVKMFDVSILKKVMKIK